MRRLNYNDVYFLQQPFTEEEVRKAHFSNGSSRIARTRWYSSTILPKIFGKAISLCNVLYKLISKIITNRLKGVILKPINHNQNPFAEGRLIRGSCPLANEVSMRIKNQLTGVGGRQNGCS